MEEKAQLLLNLDDKDAQKVEWLKQNVEQCENKKTKVIRLAIRRFYASEQRKLERQAVK